jgi:hypothetical protein
LIFRGYEYVVKNRFERKYTNLTCREKPNMGCQGRAYTDVNVVIITNSHTCDSNFPSDENLDQLIAYCYFLCIEYEY